MSSVVVVGSFNVDHVWRCDALPLPGATIAGRYSTGPGGKGFNQAVAAARAGAKTHFLCALGDDAGGALARSLAAQDGFALIAEPSNEPTGTGGIYVDGHGRNTIVIGAGANAVLSPAFIDNQRPLIAAAKVLLAQLESPAETIESALALAHECGVLTVLNAAPANAPTSIGLLKLSDVLTPNETEFAALLGRHVGERINADNVAALDGNTLHSLCASCCLVAAWSSPSARWGPSFRTPKSNCAATPKRIIGCVRKAHRPSTPPVPAMPSTAHWWHRLRSCRLQLRHPRALCHALCGPLHRSGRRGCVDAAAARRRLTPRFMAVRRAPHTHAVDTAPSVAYPDFLEECLRVARAS